MLPSLIPNDVSLLLRLIVAHVVADFALQTHSRVEERIAKKWASRWLNLSSTLTWAKCLSCTKSFLQSSLHFYVFGSNNFL